MNQTSSRAAQAAVALGVLSVLAVVAVGRFVVVGVPVMALLVGAILVYWRSQLPYREAVSSAGEVWWKLVLAGVGVLVSIALAAELGPDMDWFPWHLAALLYLAGWALVAGGGVLGAVRLGRRLLGRPAGSF